MVNSLESKVWMSLTLRCDGEDGLGRAAVDVGRVADGADVRAVIGERGVQQLDGGVAAGRAAQPLHTVLKIILQRRVRLRREVEELERNTEHVFKGRLTTRVTSGCAIGPMIRVHHHTN